MPKRKMNATVSKKKVENGPALGFLDGLQRFAVSLTAKFSAHAPGEPEDQLKPPTDELLRRYGDITGTNLVTKGESSLADRLGRPDFVVLKSDTIIGHIELKAPGKGANPSHFKGHDKNQWNRFKSLPNLIYTDGNEWALYRDGILVGKRVSFTGDVQTDGAQAVNAENAVALFELLGEFTSWTPIVPRSPKALAEFLAPFCRLLRAEVLDALKAKSEPIETIKRDLKKLLFPQADDDQFADAYAQTVVFALLLARIEGANTLDLRHAIEKLSAQHSLLSRSLEFLTDASALADISTSVSLAQRVINEVSAKTLRPEKGKADPWLYFYEDFLAAYDPKLRKDAGAYYTPVEVVRAQVRLIDEILTDTLDHPMGFVEPSVVTLDPAVGTGTYLLGIIDHAVERVRLEEGEGATRSAARSLAQNLHGFEWMVGPYAVAQLRFSKAITDLGSKLPADGPGIYLTNTLESPHAVPPAPPLFHKPIAREHERALKLKDAETVLVILGNPPYDRHEAYVEGTNESTTGGWVRHGGKEDPGKPVLEAFLDPARKAGHGTHLKNLYNLYVYFLRWSLWKVFEHKTATGPGVISFITASSYLDGDAFVGVREHMRRVCDHIDIIDLGGEGRGTRQDDNVFAIKTPVCICVAYREGKPDTEKPATVRYTRIEGTRDEKLTRLDSISKAANLEWKKVPSGWQDSFMPDAKGAFTKWPSIVDVFPWQNNGIKAGRTWVIDPCEETLREKVTRLLSATAENRAELFKNSPTGCKIGDTPLQLPPDRVRLQSILNAKMNDADGLRLAPYGYRSFDRQLIVADGRFLDRCAPPLWHAHSEQQFYLTSLFSTALGDGPACMACANIPDLDFFRGSYGAKAVMPLYRDSEATQPNLAPGLLEMLGKAYGRAVTPEAVAGYAYGVLAQPAYTERFAKELQRRTVRVPWTKDADLFERVSAIGQRLIWLHTYGQRLIPKGEKKGQVPKGAARCTRAVPETEAEYPDTFEYDASRQQLHVGSGVFAPVSPEVFEFNVSGLKVVQSWLGYRMKNRQGKKSSPLDDIRPKSWTHQFTRELLELLWVLEATIDGYPEQKMLLDEVLAGTLFTADDFPAVPENARKAPKVPKPTTQMSLEDIDTES
jgi:predicted helicase